MDSIYECTTIEATKIENRGNKNRDLKKYKMEPLALKDNNYCRIKF